MAKKKAKKKTAKKKAKKRGAVGEKDVMWFEEALKKDPKDSGAMKLKGIFLGKSGDLDGSIDWFRKALKVDAEDGEAMRYMGVSLSKKGDEDSAMKWFEKALKVKPDDYGAMRNMGVSLSKKGDQDSAIKWYEKALKVKADDSDAMRQMGVSLSVKGDQDSAIKWYEEALKVKADDSDAMREMGVSLSKKGDPDSAIKWYEKALKVKADDSSAMRQMGVSLSEKGEQDSAMKWYEKALKVKPDDYDAMRQMGVSLAEKGDFDGGIAWIKKGLAINDRDDAAYMNLAFFELEGKRFDEAFKRAQKALELNREENVGYFRLVCGACHRNFEAEYKAITGEEISDGMKKRSRLMDIAGFILRLRKEYEGEAKTFLEQKEKAEAEQREFLKADTRLEDERSVMMVLRRWNSYTPAVPSAEQERSLGGGYFIRHNGCGTVIDPGYNFIENFHMAGCRICDIDNVVLTHAHNDHTAEFETILMLLHEYNREMEKVGKARRRIRVFLNNGAFLKFSGILNLRDKKEIEKVHTLSAGADYELRGGITLRAVEAYHDELIARDQSVGVVLEVSFGKEKRNLLFTSDTGLFPLKEDGEELVPNTTGEEVWKGYAKWDAGRTDLMVVHIGSIKDSELKPSWDLDPEKACYANHLGIIGTARVIERCRPKLAVVSEFGEEMLEFRCALLKGLQENVIDKMLAKEKASDVTRVIPGDLAFIYDIKEREFYCCVNEDWCGYREVDFAAGDEKASLAVGIYYFSKDKSKKFKGDRKYYANRFVEARKHWKKMYFR